MAFSFARRPTKSFFAQYSQCKTKLYKHENSSRI